MATFKEIKGVKVVTKATDPTASEAEGTVWYNSTSPTALKYAIQGTGARSSGNNMNESKSIMGTSGVQTGAIAAGGQTPSAAVDNVETYNGTTWTEKANLNLARQSLQACGTTTAALAWSGWQNYPLGGTGASELWNNTSWTTVNSTVRGATGAQAGASAGASSTSALYWGGQPGAQTLCETWDGTSWTEGTNLNTAISQGAFFGIVTAALSVSGETPAGGRVTGTEEYNGTSWSASDAVNTGANDPRGAGTTTAGIKFGGNVAPTTLTANTEKYNGTTWTEVSDLATARYALGSATRGTNTAALAFGGHSSPTVRTNITEEWNDPVYTIKTVTIS